MTEWAETIYPFEQKIGLGEDSQTITIPAGTKIMKDKCPLWRVADIKSVCPDIDKIKSCLYLMITVKKDNVKETT